MESLFIHLSDDVNSDKENLTLKSGFGVQGHILLIYLYVLSLSVMDICMHRIRFITFINKKIKYAFLSAAKNGLDFIKACFCHGINKIFFNN